MKDNERLRQAHSIVLEKYALIIRDEYACQSNYRDRWDEFEKVVENIDEGFRHGNLLRDFMQMAIDRLMARRAEVRVNTLSEDNVFRDGVTELDRRLNQLSLSIGVPEKIVEAIKIAIWAGHSWLYTSHPIDPNNPDKDFDPDSIAEDPYEEIDIAEIESLGIDMGNVKQEMINRKKDSSRFGFPSTLGLPRVEVLDPRCIIIPKTTKHIEDARWIARVRFYRHKEFVRKFGTRPDTSMPPMGIYEEIWTKLNPGEAQINYQSSDEDGYAIYDNIPVVELHIVRDYTNPELDNTCVYFLPDDANPKVLLSYRNPFGKRLPFSSVRLSSIDKLFCTSMAASLDLYTITYSLLMQAMYRDASDVVNKKFFEGPGSGLDEENKNRILDPEYSGFIRANDPGQVKPFETTIRDSVIKALMFTRSSANVQQNVSQIDKGEAIRSITARQTDALLQATGINISGVMQAVSEGMVAAIMTAYSYSEMFGAEFEGGISKPPTNIVNFGENWHKVPSRRCEIVAIDPTQDSKTSEDVMTMNALLRLSAIPFGAEVFKHFDPKIMADYMLRAMRIPRTVRRTSPDQGLVNALAAQFQQGATGAPGAPGAQGPGSPAGAGFGPGVDGFTARDMIEGQHPERGIGDQADSGGASVSNVIAAEMRKGVKNS